MLPIEFAILSHLVESDVPEQIIFKKLSKDFDREQIKKYLIIVNERKFVQMYFRGGFNNLKLHVRGYRFLFQEKLPEMNDLVMSKITRDGLTGIDGWSDMIFKKHAAYMFHEGLVDSDSEKIITPGTDNGIEDFMATTVDIIYKKI